MRERGDDLQVVLPDRLWGTSVLWLIAADEIVTGPWLTIDSLDAPLCLPGISGWQATARSMIEMSQPGTNGTPPDGRKLVDIADGRTHSVPAVSPEQSLTYREERLDDVVAGHVLRHRAPP